MPQNEKDAPDRGIITRLHIPEDMVIDPDKLPERPPRRKGADIIQLLILLSAALMIFGLLLAVQAQPVLHGWVYVLLGYRRTPPPVDAGLLSMGVLAYAVCLALNIAGLVVYLYKKKRYGAGGVYFSCAGAVSLAAMIFLARSL